MRKAHWPGPALLAGVLGALLACHTQPSLTESPVVAAKQARSPAGAAAKLDFNALLARERAPLALEPVADPRSRWSGGIEARRPPRIEVLGDVVQVHADVGTADEVRCDVHKGELDPGATVTRVLAAVGQAMTLKSFGVYRVASVRDVPVLSLGVLYLTRDDPPLGGELKLGLSAGADYSVFCMQVEPGYRAAFARTVESFVQAFDSGARARAPQYQAIWQSQVGASLVGYSWDRIYARPDGNVSSMTLDVFIAQRASGELETWDSAIMRVHDRSGIARGAFVSLHDGDKAHELVLARGEQGEYTYKGEVAGEAVDGRFTPKAPLRGYYELLMQLQKSQGSTGSFALQQEEYVPETDSTRATGVMYAFDASRTEVTVDETAGRAVWALKDGLPVSSTFVAGPNTFVSKVITQRSALGSEPGVTFGSKPRALAGSPLPLAERRRGFKTQIFAETDRTPAPTPPGQWLSKVKYPAPLGENVAYVSPLARGKKRPAIVWIAGGFDWGIGSSAWDPASRDNDQSARALRGPGLVLMLPALRGSNENPGRNECFLGEVEDVIAALDYLARRSDVDPDRIYLGGHSTGATLALLVAASTERFRSIFAFGPVAEVGQYGGSGCLPEGASGAEVELRAPVRFMSTIRTPTFVFEGGESGNAHLFDDLREQASDSVHFNVVPGMNHFSILAPGTEAIARAIVNEQVDDAHLSVQP